MVCPKCSLPVNDNVRSKHGQSHESDNMFCDRNCFCWSLALIIPVPNVAFPFHLLNIIIDNDFSFQKYW